jgi:hypothetical protein
LGSPPPCGRSALELPSTAVSCRPVLHLRNQTPVQLKPGAMPADRSFGSDHQERLFPVGPKPARQHPEELVKAAEFWSGRRRFSTANCWRSAKFSRSSLRRERKQRANSPKLSRAKLNIHHSHSKSGIEEIVQTVDFRRHRVLARHRSKKSISSHWNYPKFWFFSLRLGALGSHTPSTVEAKPESSDRFLLRGRPKRELPECAAFAEKARMA